MFYSNTTFSIPEAMLQFYEYIIDAPPEPEIGKSLRTRSTSNRDTKVPIDPSKLVKVQKVFVQIGTVDVSDIKVLAPSN